MGKHREIVLVLHDVRSAYNVGAIFRTADAAGVSHVYLAGLTPAPVDRFGRANGGIAKTALDAERFVPWSAARSTARLVGRLKKEGWTVVGVEQDARACDYRTFRPRGKTAFVFGSEVRGLPAPLLKRCDALVEIPMRGRKESLNVAVAAGVVLFQVLATRV